MAYDKTAPADDNEVVGGSGDVTKIRANFVLLEPAATSFAADGTLTLSGQLVLSSAEGDLNIPGNLFVTSGATVSGDTVVSGHIGVGTGASATSGQLLTLDSSPDGGAVVLDMNDPGGTHFQIRVGGGLDVQYVTVNQADHRFYRDGNSGTQQRMTFTSVGCQLRCSTGNVSLTTSGTQDVNLGGVGGKVGFYDLPTSIVQQTVSGARNVPEEALANLITALANLGLIVDTTTAS